MLCVLCLIVLWGFYLVTSYSGVSISTGPLPNYCLLGVVYVVHVVLGFPLKVAIHKLKTYI